MRFFLLLSFLIIAFAPNIHAALPPVGTEQDELLRVVEFLSGSFSSKEQSEKDSAFFEVHLTMTPIWQERTGEHWLYVEQAMATALDKPYRQRIYRVVWKENTPVSLVYTLPDNPLKYAGASKNSTLLAGLKPENLTERDGCAIVLKKLPDGSYQGATQGTGCKSDLRGASYATSEVFLTSNSLTSWDRGFNAEGKQVWGAVKGAYIFKKNVLSAGKK
ncbi:MAG: chromophore lyase CpcT/CpeT [Ignavibacteria bacterium]|nr:chromophore lyase CpcT/CpeT [Ignavibacteria bacterium]